MSATAARLRVLLATEVPRPSTALALAQETLWEALGECLRLGGSAAGLRDNLDARVRMLDGDTTA